MKGPTFDKSGRKQFTLKLFNMKGLFSFRNGVTITPVLLWLWFIVASFAFGPVEDAKLVDNPPQEKAHRVKIIVNSDGKETKIDTVFNFANENLIQVKVDSMLNNLNIGDLGDTDSMIVLNGSGKKLKFMLKRNDHGQGSEPFAMMIQQCDSLKMNNRFYQRFRGDPFAFDTRDEAVISYEKKDIGNGLEKITIIRKKHSEIPLKKEVKIKAGASKGPKK